MTKLTILKIENLCENMEFALEPFVSQSWLSGSLWKALLPLVTGVKNIIKKANTTFSVNEASITKAYLLTNLDQVVCNRMPSTTRLRWSAPRVPMITSVGQALSNTPQSRAAAECSTKRSTCCYNNTTVVARRLRMSGVSMLVACKEWG